MQIELMDIDKVKPYEKNPRRNDKSIPRVQESLKRFGFRQPIVVDKNMVIIAGHTRLAAAKKLGLKQVPVHIAKDMSAKEIKAYRIMDNRSSEFSEWDDTLLEIELKDITLDDMNWSLADLGFDGFDLFATKDESPKDKDEKKKREPKEGTREYTSDEFEKFDHQCPKCGFEFDD